MSQFFRGCAQEIRGSFQWQEVSNFAERVWILFLYGYILGGILPVSIVLIPEILSKANLIPDNLEFLLTPGVLLLVFGMALILTAQHICINHPKTATSLLYLAAIIILLSLNLFVCATGGPIISQFSFFFLYLPLIVAIVFPRLRAPVLISILSVLSYFCLLNLFVHPELFQSVSNDGWFRYSHIIIFALQLALAIIIEWKVERLPREQPYSQVHN
jgi:hypothetical protein